MNRRGFLNSLIGGIAATAAVRTWPFRVYSFPNDLTWAGTDVLRPRLSLADVQAIELENFAKQLPVLLMRESSFYKRLKSHQVEISFETRNGFRTLVVPIVGSVPFGPPNVVRRIVSVSP
jgi:hypothetical protein